MSINKLDSSEWILITTALKESWPSEENKVLFLGEWCKLYKDKKHWKSLMHISKYHWIIIINLIMITKKLINL